MWASFDLLLNKDQTFHAVSVFIANYLLGYNLSPTYDSLKYYQCILRSVNSWAEAAEIDTNY